jgi:hypothetical protein
MKIHGWSPRAYALAVLAALAHPPTARADFSLDVQAGTNPVLSESLLISDTPFNAAGDQINFDGSLYTVAQFNARYHDKHVTVGTNNILFTASGKNSFDGETAATISSTANAPGTPGISTSTSATRATGFGLGKFVVTATESGLTTPTGSGTLTSQLSGATLNGGGQNGLTLAQEGFTLTSQVNPGGPGATAQVSGASARPGPGSASTSTGVAVGTSPYTLQGTTTIFLDSRSATNPVTATVSSATELGTMELGRAAVAPEPATWVMAAVGLAFGGLAVGRCGRSGLARRAERG